MRKILSLTILLGCLLCPLNAAYSADKKAFNLKQLKNKTEKAKTTENNKEKSSFSSIYSVAKFFNEYEYAANNYNHNAYIGCYSDDYLSADGFNLVILSGVIKDTWKTYPGIKYKVKLNGVTFYKNMAIADVTETAKGYTRTDEENVGEFVCTMQSIYYLKQNGKSWLITGDYTTKENMILQWGDAKKSKIDLEAPAQMQAGKEYSAILTVKQPDGIIAIGSITADKITYPQKPSKEIYRKFSSEGTIERIMKTNTEQTNEYIVGTVGFTRPKLDEDQNLDIKLTGYACIMERMNIIPINNFIEVKDDHKAEQQK